jgi:hypothetical protein
VCLPGHDEFLDPPTACKVGMVVPWLHAIQGLTFLASCVSPTPTCTVFLHAQFVVTRP